MIDFWKYKLEGILRSYEGREPSDVIEDLLDLNNAMGNDTAEELFRNACRISAGADRKIRKQKEGPTMTGTSMSGVGG